MQSITYYTVDVFTQTRFNGAQIAVLPNADGLSPEKMQKIASEFNLSETVFITEVNNNNCDVRVFSPTQETHLGSHTTVAAAHILGLSQRIVLSAPDTPVTFHHQSGDLLAHISHDNGQPTFIQFTTTTEPTVDNYVPSRVELSDILSLKSYALEHPKFKPLLVSNRGLYLVVPVLNYDDVRQAQFTLNAWSMSQAPNTLAQNILLFSQKTSSSHADFHLRIMGPNIGPQEDPPVGAAVPAFSAYLCAHPHIAKGTYNFTAERGSQATRISHIDVEMDNKKSDKLTIRVGGSAIVMSEGTLYLGENE